MKVSFISILVFALACSKKQEPIQEEPTKAAPQAAIKEATAAPALPKDSPLLNPSLAKDKAPDTFKAKFVTSKGDFVLEVKREWSPLGADRFYQLVKMGYFNDARFFRAIDGFMVQFGIHANPAVNTQWREARIQDDPVKQSNLRGYASFATSGPNSRTTQMFINYADNKNLDGMGFSPFGKVTDGMNVLDSLYKEYGEGAPRGKGPDQGRIQSEGNAYLNKDFPKLDYVKEATIL